MLPPFISLTHDTISEMIKEDTHYVFGSSPPNNLNNLHIEINLETQI